MEPIKQIDGQIEKIEHSTNEINASKKLAKINLDAETPNRQFCAQVAKQKKKVRKAHLRKKHAKTPEEQVSHPNTEFYEDIF